MVRERTITVSCGGGNLGFLKFGRARSAGSTIPALEFIDAACGIDEFLLSGEKGMACSANADFDVIARGARTIRRTACTGDYGLDVVGMYLKLHYYGKDRP